MSEGREEVLTRIRRGLTDAPPADPINRTYRRGRRGGDRNLARLLKKRLLDYTVEVHLAVEDDIPACIAAVCQTHGATRLGVPAGLPAHWRGSTPSFIKDDDLTFLELNDLSGVVTGCTMAIAETGTIVLTSGPAEGRRALTLVPDLHVCVVAEDQIVDGVPEAIARIAPLIRSEARPVTLVSGPSATSDIELHRIEGVHGPRTLVVLISTSADQ